MDKTKIATCTAPVNIAVIKYCKYRLEPLVDTFVAFELNET